MKAFALLTVVLLMALLGILSASFASLAISDLNIASNQLNGIKAFYTAEAGINKAIWKLAYDPGWKAKFENESSWLDEFEENNFQVTVQGLGPGKAEIISTGKEAFAQRVAKTTVIKSLGESSSPNIALELNNNLLIWGTNLDINPGSFFANQGVKIESSSNVAVGNKASAVGNIDIDWSSSLTAGAIEAKNYQPAPNALTLPMVDFNAYKNKAQSQGHFYSETDFAKLLKNNPNLTITGIYYVDGSIALKKEQNPTVNGLLVADRNIEIGTADEASIAVNWTPGQPAGLLAKNNIWIGNFAKNINLKGLVYSGNNFTLTKFFPGLNFMVTGAIIAGNNLEIWTLSEITKIVYNNDMVNDALGTPTSSPIINIEHWEETY